MTFTKINLYPLIFISLINVANFNPYKEKSNFKEYISSFDSIKNTYVVDSLILNEVFLNNTQFIELTTKELSYFDINEFKDTCNMVSRYTIKKIGKLDLYHTGSYYLLYFAIMNKDCSYDANECYFILCEYNEIGELIKYEIMGRLVEIFGLNIHEYFSLYQTENGLFIKQEFVEEILDIDNPDISDINIKEKEFYW